MALLCMVCLKQDELLVEIYENVEELQMDLCSLLESCVDIKVQPSDSHPKYLCRECTNELIITAKFRRKCAEAEKRLQAGNPQASEGSVLSEEIITFDPSDYMVQVDCDLPFEAVAPIFSPYCQLCGAVFQQSAALRRHIEKVHAPVTIYDCERCSQFFTDRSSYQLHYCSTPGPGNAPSKKHICQHCGKPMLSASSLAAHLRLHSGERPFVCDVCAKTFTTNGALTTHQKRHQQVLQHQCPHCDRGFVESSNLRRHIVARHTDERPHACTVCGRRFSRVYLLELHGRTHSGEKPYACGHCDRRFAQLGVLRSHERIHSGERLHRCRVCERTFSRTGQLRKHEMRHYSEIDKLQTEMPSSRLELSTALSAVLKSSTRAKATP